MVFLIDMGNTQLTLALWQDGHACFKSHIPTDRTQDTAAYEQGIRAALLEAGEPVLTGCALSSVVPPLTDTVAAAMERATGFAPVVFNCFEGLSFKVLTNEMVGADMLAGAEAVKAAGLLPAVAVDLGTATTFCCQNKTGDVLGVAIAPGVALGLKALVGQASHLRTAAMVPPEAAIGTDTEQSIRSGVILGAAALVDGLYRRMADEMDPAEGRPSLILTGGLSGLIAPFCREQASCVPDLLLEGLAIYYEHNKKEDGSHV